MADMAGSSSNSDMSALFLELEHWAAVLKSEPEVIHKLREFDAVAKPDGRKRQKLSPQKPKPVRGPSL